MKPTIAFFGGQPLANAVLDELAAAGIMPSLMITSPDAPKDRGLVLTAPEAKVWAEEHGIPTLQPASLKNPRENDREIAPLLNTEWDLFIVAAYGKILPSEILAVPKHGTLNVHPSLLPCAISSCPVLAATSVTWTRNITISSNGDTACPTPSSAAPAPMSIPVIA